MKEESKFAVDGADRQAPRQFNEISFYPRSSAFICGSHIL
jgi:hypothetical protein